MKRYSQFPRHLWPLSVHFFRGRLFLGPHDLTDLARRYGTPLYVYDLATLDHAIAAYRRGLRAWPGPSRLVYASKAWLSLPLVQLLRRRNVGLDVVSLGELEIAQRGGAHPQHLHLHGNNKSRALLARALDAGVGQVVVDHFHDLDLLADLRPPRPVSLWLRLNPDVLAPTHAYRQTGHHGAKFGLTWEEAQEAAQRIARTPGLQLTGLHTHIGSQIFQLDAFEEAVTRLADLTQVIHQKGWGRIRYLSPGGGLGVPYHPDDPQVSLVHQVRGLSERAAAVWKASGQEVYPTLVLEPGRSLIARAGMALYTIGAIRQLEDGRRIVAVDGGMSDNPRPALYGARYTAAVVRDPLGEEVGLARVVGPLCETGDFLIEAIALPQVRPGDVLAIPVSGAYHLSMASNYNGTLRPAVVLHARGDVVLMQRRERVADLVRRDLPLPGM